ncbi:MAG: NAD(P)H-hydrate epimerase [Planctomycetota bacterium]
MGIEYPAGEALTCQQIRELDVLAIEHVGIPGLALMENAGRGIAEFIHAVLVAPHQSKVLILCGSGNNGGDGYVVGRHLHNAGVEVTFALAVSPDRAQGDAAVNMRIAERMELRFLPAYEPAGMAEIQVAVAQADVIVDALLGTGSKGAPRGTMAELIQSANLAPRARRIAIDIPSGLDGDTGEVYEPCFVADATVTMVASKVGFETSTARPVVGRIVVVDIGVPRELIPGRRNLSRRA